MKKIISSILTIAFIATSTVFTSCSNDLNPILGEDETTQYDLIVTPTNTNNTTERNLNITVTPGLPQKVNVTFESTENMYRLYVTKNVFGSTEGAVPFDLEGIGVDTKADGSIDLGSDQKKNFTFNIDFDAPIAVDQTVQYTLWATTGRGDFRDATKRNAISETPVAYGTITLKGGVGATQNSVDYRSFSTVLLAAPLADGSSNTFISLYNNEVYAINQGVEYAALWDFGYYYGNTGEASFASTSNYPSNIVDVVAIGGTSDLNSFYFALSTTYTEANFDAVSTNTELDNISTPTSERINNLTVGNIVEFMDGYGNKGLIKVTEINGTNGTSGNIKFDVKVQVNIEPIKL